MNSYVHSHLQQRKSSLANLTRNSQSRQSLKNSNEYKNPTPSHYLRQSLCSNICNTEENETQKPSFPFKNHHKDNSRTIQSTDSTLAKSKGKIQDDQNGDYIRNLYKKYLGKQNKESSERLNAYTQRKLKTTESKQILVSNTAFKDFTKRALFKDTDHENLIQNDIKNPKARDSMQNYQQTEGKYELEKGNIANQSRTSIKTKKPSIKKNDKQNPVEKQKVDTKKYKSKQKVEKATNEKDKENKPQTLKKSQSTKIRSQSCQNGAQGEKQKLLTEMGSNCLEKEKIKIREKISEGVVHPHRESYCQFDTEQQTANIIDAPQESTSKYQHSTKKPNNPIEVQGENMDGGLCQFIDARIVKNTQLSNFGGIDSLELLLGEQNSLVKALKRLQKVKTINSQKLTHQKRENSSRYQRSLIH